MTRTTKFDWQAERMEMAADVRRYILDPFALVAMWIDNQNKAEDIPEYKDMGRLYSLCWSWALIMNWICSALRMAGI